MRGEFDFINNIKKRYGLKHVGDDCAVLPKDDKTDLLITADLLVEDIDFRLDWTTPELLGQKALAVSLSDIAAMGGEPRRAMTSIGVPEQLWDSDFVDRFYEGWSRLAATFGVELIGGDVSRMPDKFVVDSIVIGELPKGSAVPRSGARAGDSIFVTGTVGGAAGGLLLLESGVRFKEANNRRKELITRQLRPTPRVETGIYLRESGFASAMIDLSDGLAADLHHICGASGVGALLEADLIPFDENLVEISPAGKGHQSLLSTGEDFELLFTVPMEKISSLECGIITRIGIITTNVGVIEVASGGERWFAPPAGYRHF